MKHRTIIDETIIDETIKELLEAGVDVNATNKYGETPLIVAIKRWQIETIKELLKAGVDVNTTDKSGETPLIVAIKKNQIETIKELLEAGVDVNATNMYGETPLIVATEESDDSAIIIQLLIEAGATINPEYALIIATELDNLKAVNLLIKKGFDIEFSGSDRRTPLYRAADLLYPDIVNCLIEAGADLEAKAYDGYTPLMAASCSYRYYKITEDEFQELNDQEQESYEAKRIEAKEKIINSLIEAGADVNAKDGIGWTPLMRACVGLSGICYSTVTSLIQAGADVNAKDDEGQTPLISAIYWNWEDDPADIVQLLIESGADIEAKDNEGKTALQYAIEHKCEQCIKLLSEHTKKQQATIICASNAPKKMLFPGSTPTIAEGTPKQTPKIITPLPLGTNSPRQQTQEYYSDLTDEAEYENFKEPINAIRRSSIKIPKKLIGSIIVYLLFGWLTKIGSFFKIFNCLGTGGTISSAVDELNDASLWKNFGIWLMSVLFWVFCLTAYYRPDVIADLWNRMTSDGKSVAAQHEPQLKKASVSEDSKEKIAAVESSSPNAFEQQMRESEALWEQERIEEERQKDRNRLQREEKEQTNEHPSLVKSWERSVGLNESSGEVKKPESDKEQRYGNTEEEEYIPDAEPIEETDLSANNPIIGVNKIENAEEKINLLINNYLNSLGCYENNGRGNLENLVGCFSAYVNYFDEGLFDPDKIESDNIAYFHTYPKRNFGADRIVIKELRNDTFDVTVDAHCTLTNRNGKKINRKMTYSIVIMFFSGEPKITSINSRKRN